MKRLAKIGMSVKEIALETGMAIQSVWDIGNRLGLKFKRQQGQIKNRYIGPIDGERALANAREMEKRVEEKAERLANGLDLWTGEPLPKKEC